MNTEQKNFIKKVGALASADMKKSGVLASLTVAQAILESAWGKSELATVGNAIFGIKATKSWKGKVYCKDTKECYDGVNLVDVKNAAFRAYDSWEESVEDHSAFLKANKRYKEVIGETDYKKACEAIKAAGYATDPDYVEKLVKLIEDYELTEFDGAAVNQEAEKEAANKKYYRVQAGAFRRKEGANLMAEKIKKTGHTDVFVKLLNGLYKVQVGAYSQKSNAEATVKKLKAAGISCFITYA
ncbi:MAG: glucosaminidase domain-containing protein [Lachnospiraceae bacterium]|nr:glucosaminidase domain-containing protein [Lachnospiraceae bacterium]